MNLYPWLCDTNPKDFESLEQIEEYFSPSNENGMFPNGLSRDDEEARDYCKDMWRKSREMKHF